MLPSAAQVCKKVETLEFAIVILTYAWQGQL
jgi:hypothetical protein